MVSVDFLNKIPVAGIALLLGIDRFVNQARAVTNLVGNGIAVITVARWENAFDPQQAGAVLLGKMTSSPVPTEGEHAPEKSVEI